MDRRILFLKKQILSNLSHQFTIKEMAESVNVSTSYLQRLFVTETKVSPIEYLRLLRDEKAKELLENSFKRVKEICFEVGIRNQSHYAREFKQKYGSTPTEYRKNFGTKPETEIPNVNKEQHSLTNNSIR